MGDFEELKEGESVIVHLIAGAIAGTVEHCGMYPVDTIKTNMQALHPGNILSNHGVMKTMQGIVSNHGVKGLFSGFSAVVSGAAPAHAMQFVTYEFCKKQLIGSKEGHHPIETSISGMFATIVSDATMTPMDAIKQKMQLKAVRYNGMIDCVRTVIRVEGFSALYASYTTTLLMNIPYNAVQFGAYESLRKIFKRGKESDFDLMAHLAAGGGAGSVAAALTNPMDVAKTRLQTQGDVGKKYSGMYNTLLTIWKEEGLTGYCRGIGPRVIMHSLSGALCWMSYEYSKNVLNKIFGEK